MALVLKDRVKETTSTSGTGIITLLGAVQGFQGFSSIGEGNTTYYSIVGTTEWEVGIGTYSGGTLSRDTVLASSLNNTKVAFSVGVKDVFCTYAASKAVTADNFAVTGAIGTTSPNATVYVASLTANTSSDNGDLALSPKGTGALLSDIPDSTNAGGNKRGDYAVDWQMTRLYAAEVASGYRSVIAGGHSNKASDDYAAVGGGTTNYATGEYSTISGGLGGVTSASYAVVSGGSGNTASADYAVVSGGGSNQATGATSVVAGGLGNIASGLFASSGGGNSNTASGQGSAVPGGSNNVGSGQYSVVSGGSTNTASGDNSVVVGGDTNLANARFSSVVGGQYGTTRGIVGFMVTPASEIPIQAKAGVSQAGCLVLGVQTTNATGTKLRSDSNAAGATNQFVLQNNSAAILNIDLVGWDGTDYYTLNVINATIVRGANAASTVLKSVGYQNYDRSTGASTWATSLSADTTNGGLSITVTGQTSKTIRWVARVFSTEVGF